MVTRLWLRVLSIGKTFGLQTCLLCNGHKFGITVKARAKFYEFKPYGNQYKPTVSICRQCVDKMHQHLHVSESIPFEKMQYRSVTEA